MPRGEVRHCVICGAHALAKPDGWMFVKHPDLELLARVRKRVVDIPLCYFCLYKTPDMSHSYGGKWRGTPFYSKWSNTEGPYDSIPLEYLELRHRIYTVLAAIHMEINHHDEAQEFINGRRAHHIEGKLAGHSRRFRDWLDRRLPRSASRYYLDCAGEGGREVGRASAALGSFTVSGIKVPR